MAIGQDLARLPGGYPFEVRYSAGAVTRAIAAAEVAALAYGYFTSLFSVPELDLALDGGKRLEDWQCGTQLAGDEGVEGRCGEPGAR